MDASSPNGPEFWIATLIMIVAVYLFLSVSLILSTRNEILERERKAQWVQDLVLKS
jgi:heme exporter protein C